MPSQLGSLWILSSRSLTELIQTSMCMGPTDSMPRTPGCPWQTVCFFSAEGRHSPTSEAELVGCVAHAGARRLLRKTFDSKGGQSLLLPWTHQSSYTDMRLSREGKKCDPKAWNSQGCTLRFCVDFSLCSSVQLSAATFLANFCCVFNKNAQNS